MSKNYNLTIMKELSIEEKAKRYELALERCRKLYNEAKANEYISDIEDYETIFPELKESEEEEEIMKLANEYCDRVLIKECGMKEEEAQHCRISYIHGAKAMLDLLKQQKSK